jgi:UDP-galactopyranose mutase
MLEMFIESNGIHSPLLWFYTPMALEFLPSTLKPSTVIYDCMDELSMFRGAPPELRVFEQQLLNMADVVFTGGVSLYEFKRDMHKNIHPFPSGVDVAHFAKARVGQSNFAEHAHIPRPRLGFAGVIDERMDLDLLAGMARLRPDWHFVMIGPTAKIDPAALPRLENIDWLGMKNYSELPMYFAGWDVAIMPFALNDATRFISPTKTPEFLSAGLPVVSTPIRDVVRPYGDLGLAKIASTPEEFVEAADQAMMSGMCLKWRERADEFLKTLSWDSVWNGMHRLIHDSRSPKIPAARADSFAELAQETSARV